MMRGAFWGDVPGFIQDAVVEATAAQVEWSDQPGHEPSVYILSNGQLVSIGADDQPLQSGPHHDNDELRSWAVATVNSLIASQR